MMCMRPSAPQAATNPTVEIAIHAVLVLLLIMSMGASKHGLGVCRVAAPRKKQEAAKKTSYTLIERVAGNYHSRQVPSP